MSADVILQPRLGARTSARRQRVTIGSDVPVFFDVRDDQTGALVPGANGVSALYWLPDPAEGESAYQPLDAAEVSAGTWQVLVPTSRPGTYVVWLSIQEPIAQTAELTFDVTSVGGLTLTSTGVVPWGEVQASGAAAGASAGLAAGRAAGTSAGATAGAEAAKPYADDAAASEIVALGAADMSRDERLAAQAAQSGAESARDTAVASAQTSTSAAASAETARNNAAVAAAQAQAGANIVPDVATGLAATDEGKTFTVQASGATFSTTYRKTSGQAVFVGEQASKAAIDAIPARAEPAVTDWALAVIDALGNNALGLSNDGQVFQLLFGALRGVVDGSVRLERRDGKQALVLQDDGVALPGMVASSAALDGLDFALTDASGAFAFLKRYTGGGAWLEGLTVRPVTGGLQLTGPDGATITLAGQGATLASADIGGVRIYRDASIASHPLIYLDDDGFWVDALAPAAGADPAPVPAGAFSVAEIRELSNRAMAQAAIRRSTPALEIATADADYNLILIYGQSLAAGQEGWPALTTAIQADLDLYMLGDSEHAQGHSATSTTWVPIGPGTLKPLKATNKNATTGLLSDAEVAALEPGAQNLGESPGIAAAMVARRMWLQARGLKADPAHKWVVGNCAIGGRTIEQLSRGASPELFARLPDFVSRVKALADAEGKTVKVVAVLFCQGEYNYDATYGGTQDRAAYLALVEQLRADINAQVCQAVLGQAEPPAFVTYQTGAGFTRDAADLSIGMAQLDYANAHPTNAWLGSPHYHVTDKAGHLDPNGYRWLGCALGRTLGEALVQRHASTPLQPAEVLVRGREILLTFLGRRGNLVWREAYSTTNATLYTNRGFTLLDGSGALPISQVEIVGDMAVRIIAARDPVGTVTVRYAGQASFFGNGNLFDDDPTVYPLAYRYTAGNGQYPAANIPALLDKPYPANNPCVAFQRDATPA